MCASHTEVYSTFGLTSSLPSHSDAASAIDRHFPCPEQLEGHDTFVGRGMGTCVSVVGVTLRSLLNRCAWPTLTRSKCSVLSFHELKNHDGLADPHTPAVSRGSLGRVWNSKRCQTLLLMRLSTVVFDIFAFLLMSYQLFFTAFLAKQKHRER